MNLAKSRAFYSSGVPRSKREKCTSICHIKGTLALDKYLGFPILKGRVKKTDFDFIIEKMKSRLASWKHRLLNKPGRLVLASSVLTSIPTCYMQTFWIPQSICYAIDRSSRDFIWKGNTGRGIHLVGWDKISLSKKHGGLGVRRSREANISLLGKLVWELQQKSNKLWVSVLTNKYNIEDNFLTQTRKPGSFIWNSILKAKDILGDGYTLRLGAGNVSFWYEDWSKLGPLCNLVDYVAIHDTDMMVNNVFKENEVNLRQFTTLVLSFVKEEVKKIQIILNSRVHDAYIWTLKGNLFC